MGAGFSARLTHTATAYAQVSYLTGLHNDRSRIAARGAVQLVRGQAPSRQPCCSFVELPSPTSGTH